MVILQTMLILAGISGIQDYLFDLRETGGKQAKSLRFRSFYIQLVAEAIATRFLIAADLPRSALIFCAAGKIAISASGTDKDKISKINREADAIETQMREQTSARLRLSVVVHENDNQNINQQYSTATKALQQAKLRPWARATLENGKWDTSFLTAPIADKQEEAQHFAELGKEIVRQEINFLTLSTASSGGFDVAGLNADFSKSRPEQGPGSATLEMSHLARHIPTGANGLPLDFAELADKSKGTPYLGVLKADADSLGAAVSKCLDGANDIKPLDDLSKRLENFFAATLDSTLKHDKNWSKLYTVFSGGDDLMLVGPWNIVLDFAFVLHDKFMQEFAKDNLTISAGVALVKPKYPIRLAAQQAEDLLEQAKTGNKNKCAAFGAMWKWSEHQKIIAQSEQLAGWVDKGVIQRGWLNTLLRLTLQRRGEVTKDISTKNQLMATAHLVYHVARNWPGKRDKDQQKQKARAWADQVCNIFDNTKDTSDWLYNHLPTILRYAILATRESGKTKEKEDK